MKTAQLTSIKLAALGGFVAISSVSQFMIPRVWAQTTPTTESGEVISQPASELAPVSAPADEPEMEVPDDSITLSAIPPRLGDDRDLKAKPGETIQNTIRVRNSSDSPITINSFAQDFIVGEDGITPIPVSDETSNRWSLADWVTLSPERQTIPANTTQNVTILISVPDDALPGGHYAMVLHEPSIASIPVGGSAEAVAQASAARVAQRVGTLVYFFVDGPINEEAFVRNFQFQNFSEYGPVPFNFSVENMSDIHIKPRVTVDIFNLFGRKVDTINVEDKNVFPLMSRKYDGQWDRVWGIGLYNAKLTMSFGQQGQIVMASDQFWLIPYKLVIAAGVIILTILAVIILIRRHLIHRSTNEQAKIEMLEQKLQDMEQEKLKKFDK